MNSDHEKCLKAPDDNRDQYLMNPEQCTIKKFGYITNYNG